MECYPYTCFIYVLRTERVLHITTRQLNGQPRPPYPNIQFPFYSNNTCNAINTNNSLHPSPSPIASESPRSAASQIYKSRFAAPLRTPHLHECGAASAKIRHATVPTQRPAEHYRANLLTFIVYYADRQVATLGGDAGSRWCWAASSMGGGKSRWRGMFDVVVGRSWLRRRLFTAAGALHIHAITVSGDFEGQELELGVCVRDVERDRIGYTCD
jgi:hypothetical protein